jgi:hypothetical protein
LEPSKSPIQIEIIRKEMGKDDDTNG